MITRTRRLLSHATTGDTGVWFKSDEEGGVRTQLRLDHDTWEHMRHPQRITVTIEPGDLLNGRTAYWGDRPAAEETEEVR